MTYKTLRNLFLALVVVGALGGYYAYRQWNKPHREVEQAEAAKSVDATALFEEFSSDETAANEKYLDQIVQVCGSVASVSEGDGDAQITIQLATGGMGVVLCSLDPEKYSDIPSGIKEGQQVCLKGICTGYLMDVVLDRCVLAQ